jgi:hypothetical protein
MERRSRFATICHNYYYVFMTAARCLGRLPTDSNGSIQHFVFSVFSLTWGTCFSLKANPNTYKRRDSGTVLAQLEQTRSQFIGANRVVRATHSALPPVAKLSS